MQAKSRNGSRVKDSVKGLLLKLTNYRKIPILISPGLVFVQKAFLLGLLSGELIFRGVIIGGSFAFQNGLDLTIKTA